MKTILGLVLIVAGIALFYQGMNRKDSIAGHAAEAGTKIANVVDGGARTPKHTTFMIAGGVMVAVGIGAIAMRGGKRA